MIYIYSPAPSARLHYTASLIFGELLQTEYRMVSDESAFLNASGFRINYSHSDLPADLHWFPHELMEKHTVNAVNVGVGNWKHLPVLFPQQEPTFPFDLFAATFFLVSRYEEYLPHQPDRHLRFTAEESVAFKHGFLQRPLVNEWAQELQQLITTKVPETIFSEQKFSAEATFDIDVAWAYRNKGWWRTLAAFVLDVVQLRLSRFAARFAVVFGSAKDPYDTYDYIRSETDKAGIDTRYFFLLGDYSSFDRNSKSTHPDMQTLIRECAAHGNVGIHPSYGSHQSVDVLSKEINRLSEITGAPVAESRQHYLKMTMPETYQRLIDSGIRTDYTMGYASQVGFRASVCTPYKFFDLTNNVETGLRIVPFAYMDGTLRHYLELEPAVAKEIIERLIDSVRSVNGRFICLWHNSSLCENNEWEDWRPVFEFTLQYCTDRKAGAKLR